MTVLPDLLANGLKLLIAVGGAGTRGQGTLIIPWLPIPTSKAA
jgi:hypothetical protein